MRMISSFGKSVKGVFNKNAHYQRRWCCIEGDSLSYYKSEVRLHHMLTNAMGSTLCHKHVIGMQADVAGSPLGSVDLSIVQEVVENTEAKNPPGLAFDLVRGQAWTPR